MTNNNLILNFIRVYLITKDKYFIIIILISKVVLQVLDLVSIGAFVYIISDVITVQNLYDEYNPRFHFRSKEYFYFYVFILMSIVFLIKYTLIIMQTYVYTNWLTKKTCQIQNTALDKLNELDYSNYSKVGFTDINDAIILNIRSFIDNYLVALVDILVNIFYLLLGFIIVLSISFKISLLLLLFIIMFNAPFLFYLRKKNLKNGIKFTVNQPKLSAFIEDYFNNNYLLKIFSLTDIYKNNIFGLFKESAEADKSRKFYNEISRPVVEFSVLFVLLCVVCWILLYSNNYLEDLSSMLVVIVLLVRMLPFIQKLSQNYGQLNYYQKISSETFALLGLFSEKYHSNYNDSDTWISAEYIEKLETKNLVTTFDKKIIDFVDIKFYKGDKVLVHGKSGIGKSTLVKAILGLNPNASSKIVINDVVHSSWWINGVGYVDQRVVMFNDTLLFNITLLNEFSKVDERKLSDVLEVCRLTDLFPDFESLFFKFNSKQFSGGELQRISIARALYFQKGILVMDEATSGLSSDVSKSIISDIINLYPQVTLLCITHQEDLFDLFEKRILLSK